MVLKKIIVSMFAIVLALSVSACDSAPESNLTMEDFVSAMETAGATLEGNVPKRYVLL